MAQKVNSKTKKTQSLTSQSLSMKKKGVKKTQQTAYSEAIESLCCPKCKQLLVGMNAVRLRSCPKLTKNMQRLLRKRKENENNLTARQNELLQKALQQCSVLILKCSPCKWRKKIKLPSRGAMHQHKARLRLKVERERQCELMGSEETSVMDDKMAQKKLKKKERRKKAAEAKAQELQRFKRFSASPMMGSTEKPSGAPLASTPLPVQSIIPSPSACSYGPTKPVPVAGRSTTFTTPVAGRSTTFTTPVAGKSTTFTTPAAGSSTTFITPIPFSAKTVNRSDRQTPRPGLHRKGGPTPGKQKLRKVLNEKKANLSANESLLQFLNSMK